MHVGANLGESQPLYAAQLIDAAWDGRLALYTGAGLSRAKPSEIPDGAEVARRIYRQLTTRLGQGALSTATPDDLLSVADVVSEMDNGAELIKSVAVQVADFTTAMPNFGHQVVAHLILEGVVVVITTNWDDCIERGSSDRERLQAVISDQDRHEIRTSALLKVHGCATKATSALVSTADLASPPTWARDEVNARLADSHTVFVGIGDIARYVESRIAEARDAVGATGSLFVVSRSIKDNWSASPWSTLLPDLAEDHRIATSADDFLDRLAAAYVLRVFAELSQALAGQAIPLAAVDSVLSAFREFSSLAALQWARSCAVPPQPGKSVMRQLAFAQAVVALGVIAGSEQLKLGKGGVIHVGDQAYELLVGLGVVGAPEFRREAEARLAQRLERGDKQASALTFVVAGALGRVTAAGGLQSDILDTFDASDVVSGPLAGAPRFLHADDFAA